MYDLITILIPIVLAVCIVVSIKIVEDARLRRHLASSGANETVIRTIMETESDSFQRGALKWGLVLIIVSAAFVLMWAFDLDAENPLSYALLFAATGMGLLTFRRVNARKA
jgi:hypothetical protein